LGFPEDAIVLELRPSKVTPFSFIHQNPPVPSPKDAFDKIRIITETHKSTIGSLLVRRTDVETVCIIQFPQEIVVDQQFLSISLGVQLLLAHSKNKRLIFTNTFPNRNIVLDRMHLALSVGPSQQRHLFFVESRSASLSSWIAIFKQKVLQAIASFIFSQNKHFTVILLPQTQTLHLAFLHSSTIKSFFETVSHILRKQYRLTVQSIIILHFPNSVSSDGQIRIVSLLIRHGFAIGISERTCIVIFLPTVKFFSRSHHLTLQTDIVALLGSGVLIELYFYHFGDGSTER
jgi:hypothetical protein